MRFLRTYIEISNICNLQCSFCPEVVREKKIMAPEAFKSILKQVLPFTEQICLHLMGEPLAHPQFEQILEICNEEGAVVHLTTNGTYLNRYHYDLFLKARCLRQINFSLHSFKDNFPEQDFRPYLYDILTFSKICLEQRPELYLNYRLWNLPNAQGIKDENQEIIDTICEYFGIGVNERVDVAFRKNKNILGRIYFHYDTRFDWPSIAGPFRGSEGFCHALSQQIGIHADGTVIPCCLDKEANIPLGNVLVQDFASILNSEKLQKIRLGFQQHQLVEELCQKCTFIERFRKKNAPTLAPAKK